MQRVIRASEAILWVLIVLASVVTVLAIWHATSIAVNKPFVPKPIDVAKRLWSLLSTGELTQHVLSTLLRVLIALSISASLATFSGIAATRTRIGRPLRVIVTLLIPIPMLALLPLFIMIFGLEVVKIALIAASLYPILTVGVSEAISRIPREYDDLLTSMGAGFIHTLRYVVIPGILMPLMTSLRICIGVALSLTFVVESIAITEAGLGRYGVGVLIETAYRLYDFVGVYAGIVVLSILGFLVYSVLWAIEIQYRRARGI